IQGNGDGGGGSVAVFVHVHEDLFGLDPQPFADGVNDAAIGLVRDDAFDLGDVDLAAAHGFSAGGAHGVDGTLEGFFAVHAKKMEPALDRVHGGGTAAASARHAEQLGLVAFGPHAGGEETVRVGPVLQNGRARAIAEEHAGVAVGPVHDGRELFR